MLYAVILFAVAGAMLLGIAKLYRGPSASATVKRRVDQIKERHGDVLAGHAQAQIRKLFAQRANRIEGFASRLIPKPALLRRRLEMTGKNISLAKYSAISLGITFFIVGKMINRRVAKFTSNFPDAIELMVRGLRSGLPITETLGIVATEIQGPVGLEFRAVSDKMKIGRTMEVALQETADRLGTPEFQFFVITLAIQRETGGNLAETLSNLADVLRKRAQMKLKIRAMSSESKASAYIVGSLPFVVFTLVYLVNPDYMAGFFVDQRLIVAGLGGLCWMSIGVFIMAKMVNFEI